MNTPNTRSILIRVCLALLDLAPWIILVAPGTAQAVATPGYGICACQDPSLPETGAVTLTADVQAEPELIGVQFLLDGYGLEALDSAFPYEIVWSAASTRNGEHTITAEARYTSGQVVPSAPLRVTVANPPTFNRTLYVDAANGNDANDGLGPQTAWQTLGRANGAVQAGDTVLLRGTFTGQQILPSTSGTPALPIRFTSDPDQTAVLNGGTGVPGGGSVAVWLSASSYVVVERLQIQNVSGYAIAMSGGGHHNVVRDSAITNTINAPEPYGIGIMITQSSDNLIEGNQILDTGNEAANAGDSIWVENGSSRNRILNNTLRNGGHGLILIGGARPADAEVLDNVVARNELSNPWATPLLLGWRARRTLVEGNRISDGARNGVNSPRPGIQLNASENIVRYNEVFNNAGAGLLLSAFVFQDPIRHEANRNQIYHNVFYGNGNAAPADAGQAGVGILMSEKHGQPVGDNLIANNIFTRNTGFAFGGRTYSVVIEHFENPTAWPDGSVPGERASLNGNRLRNNIIRREPGSTGERAILRIRRPDQGNNVDYTVAEFEAAYGPDETANNLEVDPRFTNEATPDFTLQAGSPAIDQGMIIPGIDWYQGPLPDIGVYERQ